MAITLSARDLPAGYSTVNFFVFVHGAADFIAFVETVLGGVEAADARTPDVDGLVLHAEVRVGDATVMVADAKPEWGPTPAFPQVYVTDAAEVLRRATAAGAEVVTAVTDFVYGMRIARFRDPWGNLWWLFETAPTGDWAADAGAEEWAETDDAAWQSPEADYVHRTLLDAMGRIATRRRAEPEASG